MKIALFQLDAAKVEKTGRNDIDTITVIESCLDQLEEPVDLAVFPEGFPFWWSLEPVDIRAAKALLAKVRSVPAFLAGGYVADDGEERNAAFLVHDGVVSDGYFKRERSGRETFTPGAQGNACRWLDHTVIPLICADLCKPWHRRRGVSAQRMAESVSLGASRRNPIVVPTFGTDLRSPYWTTPLRAWAGACAAPVAVCAIAGESKETFEEGGQPRPFGGGGSGVYWPDGRVWPPDEASVDEGVFIVDTARPGSGRIQELRDAS